MLICLWRSDCWKAPIAIACENVLFHVRWTLCCFARFPGLWNKCFGVYVFFAEMYYTSLGYNGSHLIFTMQNISTKRGKQQQQHTLYHLTYIERALPILAITRRNRFDKTNKYTTPLKPIVGALLCYTIPAKTFKYRKRTRNCNSSTYRIDYKITKNIFLGTLLNSTSLGI